MTDTFSLAGNKPFARAYMIMREEIASNIHDYWRSFNEDAKHAPTFDRAWIAKHGVDSVDLTTTKYRDLPRDWQLACQEVAGDGIAVASDKLMAESPSDYFSVIDESIDELASHLHQLAIDHRHTALKHDEFVPFAQLSDDSKERVRQHVRIAARGVISLSGGKHLYKAAPKA